MSKPNLVKDRRVVEELQRFKDPDNYTNLFYLVQAWVFIAAVFAGTLAALVWIESQGHHWAWQIPVLELGVILVGVGQHHLGVLGHEGVHFSMFRNRRFNEVMADVFCMFPLFSSTESYRRQHLAHHKFVNDPLHDPDLFQLKASGHDEEFPKTSKEVIRFFLKQLWPVNQIRYTLGRMLYERSHRKALEEQGLAEEEPAHKGSRLPFVLTLLLVVGMIVLLNVIGPLADRRLLALAPTCYALCSMVVMWLVPAKFFRTEGERSPIPANVRAALRVGVWLTMLMGIAWAGLLISPTAVTWVQILWIAPLFTSFSLLMMIRQLLHHANAGRGAYSNSRNFLVNPLLRFTVFPLGQDLHLLHHLFSPIPHYHLRPLHEALLKYPEYREHAVTVDRMVVPKQSAETRNPTAVEVLGPDHTVRDPEEQFVDDAVDLAGAV